MTLPVCLFVGWGLARFFQATGIAPVTFAGGYAGGPPAPEGREQPFPA